jgi:integrase
LHLGYRRIADGPGTWIVRRYEGQGKYVTENLRAPNGRLVIADDNSEADELTVLSFAQAQERAKERRPGAAAPATGTVATEDYTVANAMDDYFKWLESEGRSKDAIDDARYRDNASIRPKLGPIKVRDLTAEKIRNWRDALAKSPARLRTKEGKKQQHREAPATDDQIRARRATANRIWTLLRAALNHAFNEKKVMHADEWRRVRPFKGVDKARVRYLSFAEVKRLVNASDTEFRPLVQGALVSGARYGQLRKMMVADFNPDAGTLRTSTRKGDGSEREYHITLNHEGIAFFRQMCAGRAGSELIFIRDDGSAWQKSQQGRPMEDACARAKIDPPLGFHQLRHTWASHSVMNGIQLLLVAKNLGHTGTRMVEKHYGHLAPGYVVDTIRKKAPKFGIKADRRVTEIN